MVVVASMSNEEAVHSSPQSAEYVENLEEENRGLKAEISTLIRDRNRQEARILLLRTMIAHFRDVACNLNPVLAHSQSTEYVRELLANPVSFEKAVDDVVSGKHVDVGKVK